MNKTELITLRDRLPDDLNFILATWLRGLYYGESCYSDIKKQTFMEKYHKVIQFILSTATVQVACLKEDPNVILGYSVISKDPRILHWVFIKKAWRKIGLARDLVPTSVTTVTHLTKVGLSITKAKGLEFDPFLI